MAEKQNKAEIARRVNEIYTMLLDGFTRCEIVQYASNKYSITVRQCDKYIKDANKLINDYQLESLEKRYNEAIQRTKSFYKRCVASKDKRTAATVLKELNEIEGCKIVKIEHSGEMKNKISFEGLSDEQLKELAEAEIKKLQDAINR